MVRPVLVARVMSNLQIVDVELGGPFSGPYRCVIEHDGRRVVLYRGRISLAKVAEEAGEALLIRREGGTYFLAVDGRHLDGRRTLDGDLTAELGVRRA